MYEENPELIAKIRLHDEQALGTYLVERRPQLLSFIERRLGTALRRKVEPDDLLQETSAEAVRSLPGAELNEREIFSWLCQIAERRIIDAHRKFIVSKKRDSAREVGIHAGADSSRGGLIDLLVASMTTASQAFSRDQKQIRLMTAMEALPEDQREALRLRYVEGLPSKDIAERLGKSDGSVRVMLTRALSKLQQILGVRIDAE
ncbi:MAG: sigma-70 family RNA polymerase sigma factor [Planctomycetota bacterium]|nr:sigma-70 family RNA polymerase sigma factor [Planctomycetota bacterium]